MDHDSQAAVLANDLDSMVHRIEALPPHPRYTDALNFVERAKAAIVEGRVDLHQRLLRERYGDGPAPFPHPNRKLGAEPIAHHQV